MSWGCNGCDIFEEAWWGEVEENRKKAKRIAELEEILKNFSVLTLKSDRIGVLETQVESKDRRIAELEEYKIYYDRIFAKSIVVKTEEYSEMVNIIKELERQNALLERCRAFYANDKNWAWSSFRTLSVIKNDLSHRVGGKLARETKGLIDGKL